MTDHPRRPRRGPQTAFTGLGIPGGPRRTELKRPSPLRLALRARPPRRRSLRLAIPDAKGGPLFDRRTWSTFRPALTTPRLDEDRALAGARSGHDLLLHLWECGSRRMRWIVRPPGADGAGSSESSCRSFGTAYEGTTERPANHSAASASVECESELVAQQDYRASSDGGVACLMHTAVATSVPRPETDASTDAMARPRSARWPGCARRSFSLTARNTSRESARASRAELDPMRTLDRAHVWERAFSDVPDARPCSLPRTEARPCRAGRPP
jgi:hypothetical protein